MNYIAIFSLFVFSPLLSQQREFHFYIENEKEKPILSLSTIDLFNCIGYGIETYHQWNNDTLIIDIRGYVKPAPCYTGLDVAKTRFPIYGIRSKIFEVLIRWNGYNDLWKVALNGTDYNAQPLHASIASWAR